MEKIHKIGYLLLLSAFFTDISSQDIEIIVDISDQRLYLIENNDIIESFPVSTSKYGEGSIENSFMTPLGLHEIKEKIGKNAPLNTVFISRIETRMQAQIIESPLDTEDDFVTSRILWLDGLEEGANKGPGIDSYDRYIYIHGTHEEGLIGQKASHGCIRMFNEDVINIYNKVIKGTKVYIRA